MARVLVEALVVKVAPVRVAGFLGVLLDLICAFLVRILV
jgi:hypothetical protein